jgi:N-acetylglucosaminyl-diphospho-decaprenol L-rhamnosyltransferase
MSLDQVEAARASPRPQGSVDDPPAVSAVVVTHNSARHLLALSEALSQSSLPLRRSLAIDNASVDDTVLKARDAGFDVLETGSNRGFGAACNAALAIADTEFVLLCNPDVLPGRDAIAALVDALAQSRDAAIAGAAFDRRYYARRFSRLSGNVWSFLPRRLKSPLERFSLEAPVDSRRPSVAVDYVVGAFMLCRVDALRSVGGFDEEFFLYSEEEDLARRLAARGWRTLLVSSVDLDHRHSTSSDGYDGSRMAAFRFHSLYLYYRKHHSRAYAESARAVLSGCVLTDRLYRRLAGKRQVYDAGAATAAFRSIDAVRGAVERAAQAGRAS